VLLFVALAEEAVMVVVGICNEGMRWSYGGWKKGVVVGRRIFDVRRWGVTKMRSVHVRSEVSAEDNQAKHHLIKMIK